jgi:hypothetical protein
MNLLFKKSSLENFFFRFYNVFLFVDDFFMKAILK